MPACSAKAVTGTGSVVLATSPTLVTPALGAATGTTLALGGATLGTSTLVVPAGACPTPTLAVGNSTTGFCSVSTHTELEIGDASRRWILVLHLPVYGPWLLT